MSSDLPPNPHFYIAAEIEPEESGNKPLHVTLTFVEDATPEERKAVWYKYVKLCEQGNFPRAVGFGERIKVGADKSMDACEVTFTKRLTAAFKQMYVETRRRTGNAFPELTLHTTINTDEKLAAFESHTSVARVRRLYAATTGSKKEILYELLAPTTEEQSE